MVILLNVIIYVFIIFLILLIVSIDSGSKKIKKTYELTIKNLAISIIGSFYSAGIGTDSLIDRISYVYNFQVRYQNNISLSNIISNFDEFGFVILNILISKLTVSTFGFFFIVTFIITFINLETIAKITSKYKITTILYFVSLFFFNSTFLLRQSIAVAIGNMAILYLFKNKKVIFILLSLLSITFHSSGVIIFIIGLLYLFRKSRMLPLFVFISFLITFFMFESVLTFLLSTQDITEKYSVYDLSFGSGSYSALLRGIPYYYLTILALLFRKKIINQDDRNIFLILSSIVYSFTYILVYNFYWFSRVGYYFLMPALLLVPIVERAFKTYKNRLIFRFSIISMFLALTLRQMIITFY